MLWCWGWALGPSLLLNLPGFDFQGFVVLTLSEPYNISDLEREPAGCFYPKPCTQKIAFACLGARQGYYDGLV